MIEKHALTITAALLLAGATQAAAQATDSVVVVAPEGSTILRLNRNGGFVVFGELGAGSSDGIPAAGPGTRLLWHAWKAAFRAGIVEATQWDEANVGSYSTAFGKNAEASGTGSFAAGEDVNATGENATAMGLRASAVGIATFAAGQDVVAYGNYSVALGRSAHTNARHGSFVFADASTTDTLRASVNHAAHWRVAGGFRIYTSSNLSTGVTIQSGSSVSNWGQSAAVISTSTGALLTTGGVWQNASDASLKFAFEEVSGEEILEQLRELPIQSWSYKVEGQEYRHLGPTAQDFYAAFGLGTSDVSIGTVDADGVALKAAQALERRTAELARRADADRAEAEALRAEVARLRAEVEALRGRVKAYEALEERIARLEAASAGGQEKRVQ